MPSNYTPTELEALVQQRAPEIAKDIRDAACSACNEADLVASVERVIEKFAKNFDVHLQLSRERTLINGRADAVYNRFVIEYEPPNSLRKEPNARTNCHAVDQVKQYMEGLERLDRHRKERLAGAVLDGAFFIFVRYRDDHWHVDDPVPVSQHSTETFLRYLLSLSTEKAVTPDNLVRDFGENSNIARKVAPALYRALIASPSPKVKVLFQQWQRQFREVSGYDPDGGQLDAAEVGRLYAVKDPGLDLEKLFFTIHTYYAIFIKLLALQVAHYYLMPKVGSGLGQAANYEDARLRDWLRELERGGLFAQLGIRNFLEGDFFGWYLDTDGDDGAWDPAVADAIRRLIGEIADYSLVTLDVDPEETRDLLKQLYQNLMPKKLRHALGEYYTPDWLAERLLNQLGYDGAPKWRLLDPACGSGTFNVLAIKRVRRYAEEHGLNEADVLEMILHNIVGFDLNPLAVMSARANYLLALGDLLQHRRGDISIPVYLADSILTPTAGTDLYTQHGYSFNTAVGKFTVPRGLVEARAIDAFAALLEECVRSGVSTEVFRARLSRELPAEAIGDDQEAQLAVELYAKLLELEKQGIDGIWARIIKNAFAPLFQGRFDYVAGNPPWVNWESLPADYRQETKPLWVYHNLFPHSGMDTILGKGKKDISMLMTFVAADNYLKDGGKLGFIITQSVFKTAGAGQGFRRFRLGSGMPVAMLSVDDMVDLNPFEGASNRTAAFVLQRGRPNRYPVTYNLWRKTITGKSITETADLKEVQAMVTVRQQVAQPVDEKDATSSWLTGKRHALDAVKKVIGASDYRAYEGSNTGGANGVFWLDIIAQRPDGLVVVSNITEGAKRKVDIVQAAIEPDLLYPLLRGRDVGRWRASPKASILMAQDPHTRTGILPDVMAMKYPKTYAYLKQFERVLHQRQSQSVRNLMDRGAFYSMFAVGDYTFAPYKVVWREQAAGLVAAVTEPSDDKVVIPDHKLMLVDCQYRDEAHYLCAVLNSSLAQYVVLAYAITTSMNTHILENVLAPKYASASATHRALSDLSQQAHAATCAGDTARVKEIEAEVDRLAAQLWGLTDAELKEIQESLEELG
jgi:SAM-dependent methyltransferase